MEQLGYSEEVCHFCQGKEAGYQMIDDKNKYQDACEDCVRKRIEAK